MISGITMGTSLVQRFAELFDITGSSAFAYASSSATISSRFIFTAQKTKSHFSARESISAASVITVSAICAGIGEDIFQRSPTASEYFFPALREDVYGKPYFPDAPQAQFSLSHSSGYAALATPSLPVGVDIQEIRPERVMAAVRFLTEPEQAQLTALPQEEEVQAFFRLWTLKESYGKMTGRGLLGANAFSVDLSGPAVLPPDGRQFCLRAPEGYCLSVSTLDGECEEPVLLRWTELREELSGCPAHV